MTVPKRHREDLALVQRARSGDPQAVESLLRRFDVVPAILIARNARVGKVLGGEELSDLAQDVKATIWRRLDSFLGQSTLETWMHTFCVHELMNAYRRKRRQMQVEVGLPEQDVPDRRTREPFESMEFEAVHHALSQLTPPDESILRLRHFSQYKFHEIAAELELPVNTVKTRYYRAMLRMRTLLRPHVREEGA